MKKGKKIEINNENLGKIKIPEVKKGKSIEKKEEKKQEETLDEIVVDEENIREFNGNEILQGGGVNFSPEELLLRSGQKLEELESGEKKLEESIGGSSGKKEDKPQAGYESLSIYEQREEEDRMRFSGSDVRLAPVQNVEVFREHQDSGFRHGGTRAIAPIREDFQREESYVVQRVQEVSRDPLELRKEERREIRYGGRR